MSTPSPPPRDESEDHTKRILIINPNTTHAMTSALIPLARCASKNPQITHSFFTAPSGVASINDDADGAESLAHCAPALEAGGFLRGFDGFVVACYSRHPLVGWLRGREEVGKKKPVWGILEASVEASVRVARRFGVVSTGRVWEVLLPPAVREYLEGRGEGEGSFVGVETTGLTAKELHERPAEEVEARMKEATKRLVGRGDVGAVCLGCAGMAGMDEIVRDACVELLGQERGEEIRIIDGVQAGVQMLEEQLAPG